MEILKKLFSPRYRELVRLHEERRIRNLVRGKDLSKPVTLVTQEHLIGGRCTYMGVRLLGQDGKSLDVEGRGTFVTTKRRNWDVDTGRAYESTGMFVFSGKKKVPFRKVVDVR
ncbi:MAG: hypothetical protein RLZZ283_186 [Candidatus Parcubacteria bacterium]|jgi:hypothetical protein